MFEHLRLKFIRHLISVFNESDLEIPSLIRRRYEYMGTHYNETFAFLQNITGIEKTKAGIQTTYTCDHLETYIDKKSKFNNMVIQLILEKKSPYRDHLFQYILKFGATDGELVYTPGDLERSKYSDVRNFLIEADIVEYQMATDRYLIPPDQIHLYALARESTKVVSPIVLKRRLAAKDEIGHKAELAIMAYEKDRVGAQLKDQVIHMALKNAAAGYDIKSVSLMGGGGSEPRYIEVKAVPAETYRFFWTSNERMVAELMKSHYYIYLLPVNPGKQFDIDKLKMIQDPITGILNSPEAWNVETDLMRCSLNGRNSDAQI